MKYENSFEKNIKEKISYINFNIPEYLSNRLTDVGRETGSSKPHILTIIAYNVITKNQNTLNNEKIDISEEAKNIIENGIEKKERINQLSARLTKEDKIKFEEIAKSLKTKPEDLMLVSCIKFLKSIM